MGSSFSSSLALGVRQPRNAGAGLCTDQGWEVRAELPVADAPCWKPLAKASPETL